jgi:hypothetical protein
LKENPVPAKAGDRDRAERIKDVPFFGVINQKGAVRFDIGKIQFTDVPLDALADLSAHLPESLPPHPELREGPLEELGAVSVNHGDLASKAFGFCWSGQLGDPLYLALSFLSSFFSLRRVFPEAVILFIIKFFNRSLPGFGWIIMAILYKTFFYSFSFKPMMPATTSAKDKNRIILEESPKRLHRSETYPLLRCLSTRHRPSRWESPFAPSRERNR